MKIRLSKDLLPLRSLALDRLDAVVGDSLYAQTASPVAALRLRKLAEAEAWRGGGAAGPLLQVEAESSAQTVDQLVQSILAKASEQAHALAQIETRRQRAQAAIRTAPHPAAIEAALEEFLNG